MARGKRKTRTHRAGGEQDALYDSQPKSFVIRQGKTARCVRDLVSDVRNLMMPWTAKNLKERRDNTIKDFISVAGPLRITHLLVFSQRGAKVSLRLGRLPGGPTLTFDVHSYSLQRDVRTAFRTSSSAGDYQQSPLVVLSGFKSHGDEPQELMQVDENAVEVMRKTFNALFPNIDVRDIKPYSLNRRVVLFAYQGMGKVDVRQYTVHKNLSGVSPAVQSIYESHKRRRLDLQPDHLEAILQQVKKVKEEPHSSDDEAPATPVSASASVVPVTTLLPPKNVKASRQKIKSEEGKDWREELQRLRVEMNVSLQEIGPRITMQLSRVEEGVFGGENLWEMGYDDSTEKDGGHGEENGNAEEDTGDASDDQEDDDSESSDNNEDDDDNDLSDDDVSSDNDASDNE